MPPTFHIRGPIKILSHYAYGTESNKTLALLKKPGQYRNVGTSLSLDIIHFAFHKMIGVIKTNKKQFIALIFTSRPINHILRLIQWKLESTQTTTVLTPQFCKHIPPLLQTANVALRVLFKKAFVERNLIWDLQYNCLTSKLKRLQISNPWMLVEWGQNHMKRGSEMMSALGWGIKSINNK